MVDAKESIVIDKPASAVFAFISDPNHDISWVGGVKQAKLLTPAPIAVGSQVSRMASFLGRTMHYVLEITTFQEPALLSMKSIKGPFHMHVEYMLNETEGKTTLQVRVMGNPKGFYKVASPLLALQVRKGIKRDLKELKLILEHT